MNRPLRIGIDASSLPLTPAGAGRYMVELIHGLAASDRQNEYFIFIKQNDASLFENLPSKVKLEILPRVSRPLRLAWQHLAAGIRARQLRLDIWHGTHYALPRFTKGMATVATIHDLGVFLHPLMYPRSKRHYFRHAIADAAHRADHVVTVSEATAGDFFRLFRNGTPKEGKRVNACSAIPSGVSECFFEREPAENIEAVKRRYEICTPYVLFVGTLEPRKNLVMLVHAFHRMRERSHLPHVLVIAGQWGDAGNEVLKAISACGLKQQVHLTGYIPESDLRPLYQGADLFVLPSLYEGFGFPLLEAMAGGVVALASETASLKEIAGNRKMLCPDKSEAWACKMTRMLRDRSFRRELSQYGVQRARQFSWRRTSEAMLKVYQTIGGTKSRTFHSLADGTERNGDSTGRISQTSSAPEISKAVLRTLAYADLFDYPLTADEIHRGLIDARATLSQVIAAIDELQARAIVCHNEGCYFLSGRDHLVPLRRQRSRISRAMMAAEQWLLRLIQQFPFVRCVAISGALAFENCREGDDIDLFIIVERRRLWTVYFALVLLLKLVRRRRLICLNCLVDAEHLAIRQREFFVAHQIASLQLLCGLKHFRLFQQANQWSLEYLPQCKPKQPQGFGRDDAAPLRRVLEALLKLRPFDLFENLVFRLYGNRLQRLTRHLSPEAIIIERGQIQLYTHNHRDHFLARLESRMKELTQYLQEEQKEIQEAYAVS